MFRRMRGDEQQHPQAGPTRYQMRQKLISFGGDFYIQNEHGAATVCIDAMSRG